MLPVVDPCELAGCMSPLQHPIEGGWYLHFKGGKYKVLVVGDKWVTYCNVAGELFTREKSEWNDYIQDHKDRPEYRGPRFIMVSEGFQG